jgi:DNA polymerase-3 subunit epsilon
VTINIDVIIIAKDDPVTFIIPEVDSTLICVLGDNKLFIQLREFMGGGVFENTGYSMLGNFQVLGFDLETTGFAANKHRIVQYAFVGSDKNGNHINIESLVNPNMRIPIETTDIHGISDKDVKNIPQFSEHVKEISDLVEKSIIVGHNILSFDWPFLEMEYLRCGVEMPKPYAIIDTLVLARKFKIDYLGSKKLGSLCKKYGISLERAHSADADAGATLLLLWEIMKSNPERFQSWWGELDKSISD